MAYELLVGQVPFSDTETPVAILLRHVNDPPPPPRSIKPDLDEGIEAWLLKMLSKNPADRYQHATDAWDALEEIIVTVAGPRWRRDARVLGLGGGSYTPTPMPSIPKIPTPPPVTAEPVATPPPAAAPVTPPPAPTPTPAPAPTPEPVAAAAPPPPIDAFAASEPLATAAPLLAPQADSFEWPALEPEVAAPKAKPSKPAKAGGSRRPLALIIGLLVLAGGAVAAYLALGGGGNSSGLSTVSTPSTVSSTPTTTTPKTTPTTPLLPDPAVPAAKRVALVPAGGTLFAASPAGHVARLNGTSLRQLAVGSDAASPRALAVLGRTLIVADDHTLSRFNSATLAPVGASAFGPAPVLGGGGKVPLVAATGHKLCLVGVSGPGPCVRASFVPTGVGATPGGTILAVDGTSGALVTFSRSGKKLALKGSPIPIGKRAHGPVVVVGTRAYVPISRALAVVDLGSRRVVSTVPLKVTPGAPALVSGTLVTPLPARGGVALVSTKPGAKAPAFVATGPLASLAAAGSGSLAYVANGDGTVTIVDVAKGKALRRIRVSALRGKAVTKAVLRRGTIGTAASKVTLTLHLGSGALDANGLVVRSSSIGKGSAVIELWQGGIASAIGRVSGSGVTATVHPAAGHVIVRLAAAPGAFTALTVARTSGGRNVVLTLTPKPVATTNNNGSSSSSNGSSSSSNNGSSSGGNNGGTHTTTPPTNTGGGLGNF